MQCAEQVAEAPAEQRMQTRWGALELLLLV